MQGRTTVYNEITSESKLKEVNQDNIQLEEDFLEYLSSVDRAKSTIKQYESNLHIFWCWNLEFNRNKFFIDLTKREIAKFQHHAINIWKWSPRRVRVVKATMRSFENYIINVLDDEFPDYKKMWDKIESPADEAVREKSVFKEEELKHLLDHLVKNEEYMKACWLALAMYSGRRKSELARFKVSYFTDGNLICEGALYKTPEKMTTKGRGQRGKLLYVYTLAKPFKPYLDLWMKQRESLGIDSEYLFPKYKDGIWLNEGIGISTMDSWVKTFSSILDKKLYAHALRHFFTGILSEQGIPDSVIKEIIGWDSIEMVSVYKDIEAEDEFSKYFGADGIKRTEKKSLNDL